MSRATTYDVIIIGGGMVGASLACALGEQGLHVAVVEGTPLRSTEQPSYDDRSIALAYGSGRIFAGLGLWQKLQARVEPIRHIHISDRGHFGVTRLHCDDEGVDALGYVVETRALGELLHQRLLELEPVELYCPAQFQELEIEAGQARVKLEREGEVLELRAPLVVAADGARSQVREQQQISVQRFDYGQTAIIANVTSQRPHANVAYERFTDSGPLAMLPMPASQEREPRCSLVWTVRSDQVDEVMSWDETTFLSRLQERFGQRLGKLNKAGARHAYPLALLRADEHVRPRLALIGNAAHTLHPVAGQGFNLGIRDVAVLAELLVDARQRGADLGSMSVLQRYADWRKQDHRNVITFTDSLARLFSNPLWPVVWVRNMGLLAMDLLPPVKHPLTRLTMGLGGRLPRLGRGLPLRSSRD